MSLFGIDRGKSMRLDGMGFFARIDWTAVALGMRFLLYRCDSTQGLRKVLNLLGVSCRHVIKKRDRQLRQFVRIF
jgi:hypothetical protein